MLNKTSSVSLYNDRVKSPNDIFTISLALAFINGMKVTFWNVKIESCGEGQDGGQFVLR